jgi:hypothetical protein
MPMHGPERFEQEERERDLREGLGEEDPHAELMRELELADRIADQASLPPGHPSAIAAARQRLGRGPSPYEQAHRPEPRRFAAGERVSHHAPGGDVRSGRVLRTLEDDGLVEVDFGRHGTTLVDPDQLEPEPA